MPLVLEGGPVARDILTKARDEIARLVTRHRSLPRLAVVLVGDDPSSAAYARSIRRTAHTLNVPFELVTLAATTSTEQFDSAIEFLNTDRSVAGIMVLQPLPPHLPKILPSEIVDPEKDVDGMTLLNIGRLEAGSACLVPSTPLGGIEILRHYEVPVASRHAVIVGRSLVVGKPLASMLLRLDATVTVCHSRTPNLSTYTESADIVALAAGRAGILTAAMIRPGTTVLDFGVNVLNGKMVGDADPSVAEIAGAFTPVPGGTGVVTNAVLMRNVIAAMRNTLSRSGSDF